MKMEYTIPEMKIMQLEQEDIVTTSGDGWNPDDDSTEIISKW